MSLMSALPRSLYSAAEVRAVEACAIRECGISSLSLMERAGQAAFGVMQKRWPQAKRIVIFCGSGNNGGDGYVIAALARRAGKDVTVIQVSDRTKMSAEARATSEQAIAARVDMQEADGAGAVLASADLVIDALLGIGLTSLVRDECAAMIRAINSAARPVLAIDIPSGLCADTGSELGVAVRADVTVSFIGLKRGLCTNRGPSLCGDVFVDELGIPKRAYADATATVERLAAHDLANALPVRARDAHKGHFGHVLVIGGDHGYAGAALLAAESAARCGAGLVSVATRPEHLAAFTSRCPELMVRGVTQPHEIDPLLARATVVAVGPGLGTSEWGEALLSRALCSGLPLVLDADALNVLAGGAVSTALEERKKRLRASGVDSPAWILTPHPGEAARLLRCETVAIQANRFRAARTLQQQYGGVVLLKGAGTLVDSGDACAVSVIAAGNPGMATGGMGDVLTGVIAALVAQQISLPEAARLGALAHGAAADRLAARDGERGLLATDLGPALRALLNGRSA